MDRVMASPLEQSLLRRWEPVYRSRLHYLVTWSTRGRKPVLRERHAAAIEAHVEQTCKERGYSMIDFAAGTDHVHVLIGLKPAQSISGVVRELKGGSSVALLSQHPELRVWLRGNLLWDERYAAETVSPSRIEKVRARMRSLHAHGGPELARAS